MLRDVITKIVANTALYTHQHARLARVLAGELELWAVLYSASGVIIHDVVPLTVEILQNPTAYARYIDVYFWESGLTADEILGKYKNRGHWLGFIGDGECSLSSSVLHELIEAC